MADRVVRVRLSAEVAEYKRAMDEAAKSTRDTGSEAEKLAQKRQAFESLGRAALGVGTAMTAMTALTVKAAIGWESAWAGVTKTVDGTPEQLGRVEEGLRGLTAVLPASHDEIAGVAEAAGQLGIQTENVVGFTKTMIDLGETTNLSANDAATALARFTNIMGTSQSDVSNLGSALVGLGNNYATTESEILEMSMRLAGAGKQIGLTEGDVLGLATSLSSVGIEAEAGGSAMSKVMVDIAASVDEGGERVAQFAQVAGMSAEEFSQQWRTAPSEALAAFVKGLANAESQGSSTLGVLADLGINEVRMRDALLRSASAADMFTEAMATGNAEFEANNALTEEAAKRYETIESKLAIAANAVRDAAIDFGEVFLPAIGGAADKVGEFAQFLGDLPDPVQGLVGVIGALGGAAALAGGAFFLAVPKIQEYNDALTALDLRGGRADRALRGVARAASGIAVIGAAVAAVETLSDALASNFGPSAEETANKVRTATSAVEQLRAAMTENYSKDMGIDAARQQLEGLGQALDQARQKSENWFFQIGSSERETLYTIQELGKQLGNLAGTDLPKAQAQFARLAEEAGLTDEQILQLIREMPDFEEKLLSQASAMDLAASATGDSAEQQALLELAMGGAEDATADATAATAEYEQVVAEAQGALDDLKDAIRDYTTEAYGVQEAQDNLNRAINDSVDALATFREEGYDAAEAMSGTSNAGIELRDTMADIDQAARDSAVAILENGGTVDDAMEAYNRGRQRIIDMLTEMGVAPGEAQKWADRMYGPTSQVEGQLRQVEQAAKDIPANPTITLSMMGYSEVYSHLMSVQSALRSVTGNHSVHVSTGAGGQGGLTYADGGLLEHTPYGPVETFANGGTRPGIYPGGANIIKFAEPETLWEAYISGKPSERDRNVGVWVGAGERLGVLNELRGVLGAGNTQGPLVGNLTLQSSGDFREDVREVNFQLRALQRGGRR